MNKIIEAIQRFYKENNFKKAIVGISGGVDSAVVCALLVKALGKEKVIAVYLPNRDKTDYNDVKELSKKLKLNLYEKDIGDPVESIAKYFKNKLTIANIISRIRMVNLYAYANDFGGFVCGTTNLSEYMVGYFTKFGDGACDFEPIMHLYKSQVYELAKDLNIPVNIIDKAPSATLWPNQTDEKEMGVSYDEIEKYLKKQKISPKSKLIIEKMVKSSYHKRRLPVSI
jgi:NAD+ synthase